jgi:methylase of polypeptide subunit release factors
MDKKNKKQHGVIFTKSDVAHFILDEVGYCSDVDLSNYKILEPAAGEGIFAIEIVKRLKDSSSKFGFDFFNALNRNVSFVELNVKSLDILRQNIFQLIQSFDIPFQELNEEIYLSGDYLKLDFPKQYDGVVGNPPYIRHELIENASKEIYKRKYDTFKFRADIYILFYERSLELLSSNGILSFICSNRWLYNQYGQLLRKKIAQDFHLKKLVNIEKATLFDENVVAYPCISTITKQKENFTFYFESQEKEIILNSIEYKTIRPPQNEVWSNLFLSYDINQESLSSITEQGYKIGIGVATGADKIFIKHDSTINGIEKDRLIPIIKSKALKGNKVNWDNSFVINPFENGKLCDLGKYPHLKKYLYENKELLEKRHIAKKNPKFWYKTIDKINLELLSKPKILLPDLAGSKFLHIDNGIFYPHHNVYYITHNSIDQLKILACLLMSDFTKNQLSQIGIRMNGGLPRYQAQTLKKIRLPIITNIEPFTLNKLLESYNNKDLKEINKIVEKYCIQQNVYTNLS